MTARIWSAITLYGIWFGALYGTAAIFSTALIIGSNKSVSKLVSVPCKTEAIRSNPAPVSMFLEGNSLYSLRGVPGTALNCEKTIPQISI